MRGGIARVVLAGAMTQATVATGNCVRRAKKAVL